MNNIEIVKAYYAALDSGNLEKAGQYLADDYQFVDFSPKPMDRHERLEMLDLFRAALPNLQHSLSNIRVEDNVVKVTAQLSGINTGNLDLRKMGIGIVPSSKKFIIFPNGNFEFTVIDGKITIERDVSPVSPNRRMSGMLKAMGVNVQSY